MDEKMRFTFQLDNLLRRPTQDIAREITGHDPRLIAFSFLPQTLSLADGSIWDLYGLLGKTGQFSVLVENLLGLEKAQWTIRIGQVFSFFGGRAVYKGGGLDLGELRSEHDQGHDVEFPNNG